MAAGTQTGIPSDTTSGKQAKTISESADRTVYVSGGGMDENGIKRRPDRRNDKSSNITVHRTEGDRNGTGNQLSGISTDSRRPVLRKIDNSRNYRFPKSEIELPNGEMARIDANIAAIETLKKIEAENREATASEKDILLKYVGWGALANVLDEKSRYDYKYESRFKKLEQLLTPEERQAAKASTLNAHYTPASIIKSIWNIARRLGFSGGKILEPAVGIGHFFGFIPKEFAQSSKLEAYEIDSISGRIAQKLYPDANIKITGYENAIQKPGTIDLIITNVPFAKVAPYDPINKDICKFSLHNYFIAKGLRHLKPGGLGIFVTSSSTMDNNISTEFRQWATAPAQGNSDFIGAIRLPNNTFLHNAGTQVTTDILIYRKRDESGMLPIAQQNASLETIREATIKEWDDKKREHVDRTIPIIVNEYYAQRPEMMLGEMKIAEEIGSGGLYSKDNQTLYAPEEQNTEALLKEAIKKLPENIMQISLSEEENLSQENTTEKENTYVWHNKKIYFVENQELIPFIPEKETFKYKGKKKYTVDTIRPYIDIKNTLKQLIEAENSDATNIETLRHQLKQLYDNFIKNFGTFNNNRNLSHLKDDIEYPLVFSLEILKSTIIKDKNGKEKKAIEIVPADILTRRVNYPFKEPEYAETLKDAVSISLSYRGKLNLLYLAKLRETTEEDIEQQLIETGLAYVDPQTNQLIDRETYLSGNVREKYHIAEEAVKIDTAYQKNLDDLKEVLPPWIPAHDIRFRLGTTWIPPKIIMKFTEDELGIKAKISFNKILQEWNVDYQSTVREDLKQHYSTSVYGLANILEAALNLKKPVITYKDSDGHVFKDEKATTAVHEKIKEIEDLFIPYISKNTEALSEMEVIYNEQYNNFRNKKYDLPTFDVFPGANPEIHLKQHQKKGALRCLSQCTLLAHGVGTGKTYTMITAASEMRRLKLAKKPLMVVQNATIDQFATSFIRLYPNARILVPSEKERSAERRKHLFNLINTGDWDAVIIPQSFIDRIPDNPERVRGYIRLQIEGLEEVVSETEDRSVQKRYERRIRDLNAELAKLDEEGKDADTKRKKIKDIERLKLGAAKKLHRQSDRKTDDILTFEQMGIDALFIDEAHAYKRLDFYTKMENIKGIDSSSSKRAFGVFMKTRWIQEKTGGHNVIFATGTPITNTMAEIWTMMKFIAPDILTAYNIKTFDEFATTFGSVEPSLEFTATGNFKIVERFKSYFNIPELSTAFRTNTDIVLSSDVVEFQNSNYLPKLHNNKMQPVIIEQTPGVESINEEIKYRLEKWYEMPGSEKRKHMAVPLVLFSKAKQAAIDLRLIAPSAPDEQGSKVNKVINNILRIYKESDEWKGTQLIFCDLYQSPDPTKIGSSDQMLDLNGFFGNDKNIPRFNLYVDIKKKLIANGIPEPEIAIITDYPSNKRETLYEKVNAGQIRILIGGTEKMGVGVNVQERAYALHHIDAPARPMDIEQRNGRIIRQGNLHAQWEKPIHIYTYGVERTLDATAYQRLAIKQNFINQILKGDYTGREMEEMRDESDTSGMSFSEMTATLSGDQNAMLLFKARHELKKLETSKYNFEQNKKHLEYSIRTEKSRLEHLKADLPEIICFADAVAQLFPTRKITSVRIGKQTFSEKLSTHIQNAISNYVDAYEQSRAIELVRIYINELQSPVIIMYADSDKLTYTLRIENEKYIKDANSGLGILNSINNYLEKAGNIVSEQKDKISTIQKKIDGIEAEIKRPFSKQEEIKTLECVLKKESSENDNKTEQFRMVTNTQSNELTSQQKQKIITRLSTELNTSVEMHSTRDETPAHIRRQMTPTHRYPGYFDPQTGKVHIILGELTTEADIQATMLHEIVAHKGISELLGKRTTEFYNDLYMSMTEADRQKYGKKARNNQEAAAEYAASFAEAGINSPSAWHKVKAFVRAFLRDKFGFNIKISDNDLKYILWKAQNRFKKSDTTVDMINKSYNDLKIKESLFNPDKDSILFHEVAGDDTAFEIADPVMTDNLEAYYRERAIQYTINRDYPDELIRLIKLSKARRGVIDQFVALKDFQDLIAQKTGKTIKPDENSYLYSKVYMSKAGAMIDDYKQNYLSPLHETIRQIKHKVDYKYLLDYVRVKHGIERNKEMREEIFQKLKEETSKLFQQKEIELSDYMTLLQKQADELNNKDFSGIFPIVYEHHFKLPSEFVNEAENKIGNTLAEQLWRDTKQATDRILEISYNCNLMSKERYQELKEKDNYYVPLRSWEEERADEVNNYVTKSAKPTTYSKANIHAKGRESKSDDPFLYIEAIANTEIVRGHKNLMKLRLYNLCNNRKIEDKYIITHKNGTKEEQPYPPSKKRLQKGNISEIEEKKGLYSIQYHWEVAERDLMGLPVLNNFGQIASWVEADYIPSKAEQDAGLARKKYHKYSPFLKSTAGQIVEQKIELFVAGDPITITFHEPTIPDTVNGMLNQAINDQAFYKMLTPVTRFLSAAYTSWNPEFFLYTNLFRDLGLAETMHFIEKGKKYTSQFNKNIIPSFKTYRRYIFKLKQSERKKYNSDNYKKLIRKIQEGQKLETEDYNIAISLFIASGGETGYAILRETETIRDDIEKLTRLKKTRWEKFKESSFANFLSHTSRVTEGISRFATFLTSLQYGTSIEQAILDAKNVTVNFNVRGSGEGISIADIVTSFGYIDARDKMKIHPVLKYIADIQIPMRFFQAGYTFFNATIQGTDKIYQVTKTYRKQMAAVAGTFYALGLLNALLSYLLSDDDDELKISEYYKIPEHVRRNNLLIGANKIYYTLPLPQVLRTFFGWGTMTFDALSGNFHNKNFALEIVSSAFDDISPVDVGGSRAWWIPTPVKPAYEAYIVNEDWLKRPIAKDTPYNQDLPEYRRVYSRTGTIYIKTSQALNYLSGGDYATKGILDGNYNNPARFQHLIEGYLGGLTKTISKTSGFIENGIKSAIGTGELTSTDIPIIGKMVAYSSDYVVINQYRQEFFDKKKKYETQTRRANAYLENGDLEKWQKIATDEKYLIINTIIDSCEPTLKQIAELKKQTNEPTLLKQLENTENELLVQAVLYIRNPETLTRKK